MDGFLTPNGLKAIRVYLDPIVVSGIAWLIKVWIRAGVNKINAIITDNNNRIKDDVIAHVNKKFDEHESMEIVCINNLKQAVTELKAFMKKLEDRDKNVS